LNVPFSREPAASGDGASCSSAGPQLGQSLVAVNTHCRGAADVDGVDRPFLRFDGLNEALVLEVLSPILDHEKGGQRRLLPFLTIGNIEVTQIFAPAFLEVVIKDGCCLSAHGCPMRR